MITDGTIRASEIIVSTTGADFVFADDYELRPLSEVKTFIQENKHLPEIKSAQEMQENGVGINELQTQLLQKIEELTLYILQQEERIKALETELNKIKLCEIISYEKITIHIIKYRPNNSIGTGLLLV